mgnify:FL=1
MALLSESILISPTTSTKLWDEECFEMLETWTMYKLIYISETLMMISLLLWEDSPHNGVILKHNLLSSIHRTNDEYLLAGKLIHADQ